MPSLKAYVLIDHSSQGGCLPYAARDVLVHLGGQVATGLETSRATIVARPTPVPVLAALGRFPPQEITVLERLSRRCRALLRRTRVVSYPQLERDSEILAQRLSDRLPADTVAGANFFGIPRGGLVVLGMLSYALDLPHDQLDASPAGDNPLVVVDDCALTGSRFRRFLRRWPDRDVVFAPLYAHPDLCSAIEQEEPQVTACVNAQDLHDYAPDDLGDDYAAWRARWHDRHPDERYWIGRTEHLCFPWGETDTATWDAEREQVVQGLSVVPPEHRLKTHPSDEARGDASASVQVQPAPDGPIRPVSSVLFGTVDGQTIVANPETGSCLALDGTAATMWHTLIEHGVIGDTLDALLDTYTVDRATLRDDLTEFIERLASNDLLHVPDGVLD